MKRILELSLLALLVSFSPAFASASESNHQEQQRTTSSSTTTIFFFPGLALAVPFLTTTGGMSTSGTAMTATSMSTTRFFSPKGRACRRTTAFLQENYQALREDVMLGGGPALDDLAHIMEVDDADYFEFAAQLRAYRNQLLPHLHESLDRDDATAFIEVVVAATQVGEA